MKKYFLYFLFFFNIVTSYAQSFKLIINGENENTSKVIDSIGYLKNHDNAKSVVDEIARRKTQLISYGYLSLQSSETLKLNDSTFSTTFSLGKRTRQIRITVSKTDQKILETITKDTVIINISEIENYLNQLTQVLEKKGYAMNKVRLNKMITKEDYLMSELEIYPEKRRVLNKIIIEGFPNFPKNHLNNLNRNYKNTTFNQSTLEKIRNDVDQYRFVRQIKNPEILFKKDSTHTYIYVEKNKANKFDGFVGFTNNDASKVVFNGYADIELQNILNSGEKFSLYWKSDGQQQRTFNFAFELPYIANSPLILKTELNIFKQDTTFQNTTTRLELGYALNYNNRLFLGYQSTESSDIQNSNNTSISDFENTFYTLSFESKRINRDQVFFSEKLNLHTKFGFGKRTTNFENNNQYCLENSLSYNIQLNNRNLINLSNQTKILLSDRYVINELYRFGGVKSIRGFNENSLQGDIFSALMTEYRYILSGSLYAHTILDYGYFKDNINLTKGSITSFGAGIGILTKNGIFNIIYANGNAESGENKFSDSIIHISLKTFF